LEENKRKGDVLMSALKDLPKVKEVRGKGLMIGFDIDKNAWSIIEKAITRASINDCGLLLLAAGTNTLRLLPPFTLTDDEIELGIKIIKELLD
jgi:acetylornithine/succinyldiaminopimelate/putrescine aminotransferase